MLKSVQKFQKIKDFCTQLFKLAGITVIKVGSKLHNHL